MNQFWLLFGSWVLASCVAVRTVPQLDSGRSVTAERYAAEATLSFWTELLPRRDPNHGFLHLLTLGVLPTSYLVERTAHLRAEWPDRVAETGRLEVSQESIRGWFAWCWWFSPEWEMGSMLPEWSDRSQRIETTLLNRLAEPTPKDPTQ